MLQRASCTFDQSLRNNVLGTCAPAILPWWVGFRLPQAGYSASGAPPVLGVRGAFFLRTRAGNYRPVFFIGQRSSFGPIGQSDW